MLQTLPRQEIPDVVDFSSRPVPPRPSFAAAVRDALPVIAPGVREFSFTPADFERVRVLIHRKAGISLSSAKQDMVYSRLARRVRATGAASFEVYLNALERGDSAEWEKFINALTTNLTSFFREPHHFPILGEHLKARVALRPLKVWCCASSTGEEPYSIAMTLVEMLGAQAGQVSVMASDLDTQVLSVARAASYGSDRVDRLEPERLRRFFETRRAPEGVEYVVKPEVRRLLSFQRINLLDPTWPVRGPFDAIFCRNVMIYFDKDTQYKILSRFAPMLAPDGLLFAGHSESFLHAADLFRSRGKTVYELAAKPTR